MSPLPSKATLVTSSKQTQETDNIAKGRSPVQPNFHPPIFPLSQFPKSCPITENTSNFSERNSWRKLQNLTNHLHLLSNL